MACFHPLQAFRIPVTGIITFNHREIHSNVKAAIALTGLMLPCGRCVGCRLERSRQWAVRISHEASLYEHNCFITLTYDEQHLPADGSLHVDHFQKFMKRLRKQNSNKRIRFYHCGEYGEKLGRPHYHAIIFNHDFDDKEVFSTSKSGVLHVSAQLEKLWPFGYSTIGSVTFESAAYCARYVMKKITGRPADDHYTRIDETTGEIFHLKPEYNTMSRRPGIAADWFKKFSGDLYPKDFFYLNGKKMRPVRFYYNLYEHLAPASMQQIKDDRKIAALKFADDQTPERLGVRERCLQSRLSMKKRPYEKS